MIRSAILCLGVVLVACSGRLQFDPRVYVDGGAMPPSTTQPPPPMPKLDGGAPVPPPDARPLPPPADVRPAPDAAPTPEPDAMPTPVVPPPADARAREDAAPAASACPTGTNVVEDVLKPKCGTCHGAAAPAKNLDLVSTGLAARVVNRPSTCSDRPYLDPALTGNAATGLLLDKLAGPVSNCGVQMPPAGLPALTETDIACIRDWAAQAVGKTLGR